MIRATPHAGTYVLMFDRFAPNDAHDKTPAWDSKTIIARLVTMGDHDELFFDGDYRPPFSARSLRCEP
jgi:hypothetical protein